MWLVFSVGSTVEAYPSQAGKFHMEIQRANWLQTPGRPGEHILLQGTVVSPVSH